MKSKKRKDEVVLTSVVSGGELGFKTNVPCTVIYNKETFYLKKDDTFLFVLPTHPTVQYDLKES